MTYLKVQMIHWDTHQGTKYILSKCHKWWHFLFLAQKSQFFTLYWTSSLWSCQKNCIFGWGTFKCTPVHSLTTMLSYPQMHTNNLRQHTLTTMLSWPHINTYNIHEVLTFITFPFPILKRNGLSTPALLSNTWKMTKYEVRQNTSIESYIVYYTRISSWLALLIVGRITVINL